MKKLLHVFRISRDEWRPAALVLLLYGLLTLLFISHYSGVYSEGLGGDWKPFNDAWRMSGFDFTGYTLLNRWGCVYSVYRHPLMMYLLWPLYALNQGVLMLTGVNIAPWLMAFVLLFSAFYSCVFLYRIFKEVLALTTFDSISLTMLTFGFGYVMLTFLVPDHFAFSFFLLVLAAYICGKRMRSGRPLKTGQTVLYFLLTAGVTLSNGIKILIDALFVNGRSFFHWRYLLLAVVLPCALIWGVATWGHVNIELPRQEAGQRAKQQEEDRLLARMHEQFTDTTSIADSAKRESAFLRLIERREARKARINARRGYVKHRGTPITETGFGLWTDVSTPRLESAVENLFGESIQFHQQHFLGDTLRQRPVIVKYDWVANYVVEALVFLLFVLGIVVGWRERLLQMFLAGFAFDLLLHFGLGFGLNEVYIMTAHWIFVVPVAMAFLFRKLKGIWHEAFRYVMVTLAVFLWFYNYCLLLDHFQAF